MKVAIIKSIETNYYEIDWYPSDDHKAYIAIRGIIEKGTILPIMVDEVRCKWQEDKDEKIKSISKKEFLNKANAKNIVCFTEADSRNYLLHYPKKLQNVIDSQLLEMGIKPHKRLTGKEQLQLIAAKEKNKEKIQKFKKTCKKEKCR